MLAVQLKSTVTAQPGSGQLVGTAARPPGPTGQTTTAGSRTMSKVEGHTIAQRRGEASCCGLPNRWMGGLAGDHAGSAPKCASFSSQPGLEGNRGSGPLSYVAFI